jgi:hypothetical protein
VPQTIVGQIAPEGELDAEILTLVEQLAVRTI